MKGIIVVLQGASNFSLKIMVKEKSKEMLKTKWNIQTDHKSLHIQLPFSKGPLQLFNNFQVFWSWLSAPEFFFSLLQPVDNKKLRVISLKWVTWILKFEIEHLHGALKTHINCKAEILSQRSSLDLLNSESKDWVSRRWSAAMESTSFWCDLARSSSRFLKKKR